MNLKLNDEVYWKNKAGKTKIGKINRQRANDTWEILGDDGEIYVVEEERLMKVVWI